MPIAVGSSAPDFTLKSKTADGLVDVKLSDNFGSKPTVVLFFPLAFTGVCTQEFCDVSALDTACVWGRDLTMLRLEDRVRLSCACAPVVSK